MSRTGVCNNCKGTGTTGVEPDIITCVSCLGTGIRITDPSGAIQDILTGISVFNNLSPTCKVASCIDSAEYLVLVDAAKDGVKIVLSCGFVDMREDQWARTVLFQIFGESTLTRASLIAMFG